MPLNLLLALVTSGIALVMLVTHVLGGSRTPALDAELARRALTSEHPHAEPVSIRLDTTGRTAVLFLADGRVGVVTMIGDHPAVRLVPGDAVVTRDDDHLRVRFGDVGWPAREIELRRD